MATDADEAAVSDMAQDCSYRREWIYELWRLLKAFEASQPREGKCSSSNLLRQSRRPRRLPSYIRSLPPPTAAGGGEGVPADPDATQGDPSHGGGGGAGQGRGPHEPSPPPALQQGGAAAGRGAELHRAVGGQRLPRGGSRGSRAAQRLPPPLPATVRCEWAEAEDHGHFGSRKVTRSLRASLVPSSNKAQR